MATPARDWGSKPGPAKRGRSPAESSAGSPSASVDERRGSRNQTPLPVWWWVIPQLVAKWSTSSRPRPRSESSSSGRPACSVTRSTGGRAEKSVTVTVRPSSPVTTSRSISVPACRTPLVESSVVSSSASSIRSLSWVSSRAARTKARAAAGVRRSAGNRMRRTTGTATPCSLHRSVRADQPCVGHYGRQQSPWAAVRAMMGVGRPPNLTDWSEMTTVDHRPLVAVADDEAILAELADALRRARRGDFKVRLSRRTGSPARWSTRSTRWSPCRSGRSAT